MHQRWLFSFVCVALGWGSSGCGVEVLDDASATAVPFEVEDAFGRSCGVSGCHEAGQPAAGLALVGSALEGLVDRPSSQRPELSLVRIGDVGNSYLALKILPPDIVAQYGQSLAAGTSRMPLGGSSDAVKKDIAVILGWIAGAELPAPETGGPPSAESFQSDVMPLLKARCGCHQVSGGAGGLEYDETNAYEVLVSQPSSVEGLQYVVPGDPDNSYLLAKAEGRQAELGGEGDDMPPPLLGTLSQEDQLLLRTWIELGANP